MDDGRKKRWCPVHGLHENWGEFDIGNLRCKMPNCWAFPIAPEVVEAIKDEGSAEERDRKDGCKPFKVAPPW